jgi:uncharacterized protein
MVVDRKLIDLLVCPQCKGSLVAEGGEGLLCKRCQMLYPVQRGVPVMIPSEARDLRGGEVRGGLAPGIKLPRAGFRVTEGPDTGLTFQLEQGSCRAIGRAAVDPNRTAVFSVDVALALDEGTRGLILQYIQKQFQRVAAEEGGAAEQLGGFRRAPDVVLTDASLSRLHAMLFSDGDRVAVLDLVSKNGTYVNGQEVESRMLARGDVIELGDTAIAFER